MRYAIAMVWANILCFRYMWRGGRLCTYHGIWERAIYIEWETPSHFHYRLVYGTHAMVGRCNAAFANVRKISKSGSL